MQIYKYLFEKLNYKVLHIKNVNDIATMQWDAITNKITFFAYDTETDGLNIIKCKPFLVIFGFAKCIYLWDANFKEATYAMFDIVRRNNKMLFAHNAKFDYHMLHNIGTPIPEDIELSDSMTIARLINSSDDEHASMRLEKIGEKYVDKDAKFAGHLIKDILQKIKAERKKMVCDNYKMITGERAATKAWEEYINRVQFITKYHEAFDDYKEPTYRDAFLREPELMYNYAADDVVILLEFLKAAGPIYMNKYRTLNGIDMAVWKRENKLLRHIAETERNGFTVDIDYLIQSHYRVKEFQDKLYEKLHKLTGEDWKVGQHKTIIEFFRNRFGLVLESCDKKTINKLCNDANKDIAEIAKLIKKLRTVDKWLSTYIDGVLNKIIEEDGMYKLHTSINNNGTVSGRVSCDLQQMPKYAITETDDGSEDLLLEESLCEDGHELFHPRRYVIPSPGYHLYFSDYSQLELRVQAFYTIISGGLDYNLCKAYMPYDCRHYKTGEQFNYMNPEHIKHWGDFREGHPHPSEFKDGSEEVFKQGWSIWIDNQTNEPWVPTDLHSKITMTAFPELEKGTPEFKKARYLGKATNFGKIYGIGPKALAINLDVDLDTAQKLSDGFNATFPGVQTYWNQTQGELALKGYTENLYGRKYYIENPNNGYKVNNYRIQGSGADMLKEVEIKVCEYLKDKKSRFILPIHDELCIEVAPEEEEFVPRKIKEIMEDVKDVIPYLPIVSEVEMTKTNWSEKKEVYFD